MAASLVLCAGRAGAVTLPESAKLVPPETFVLADISDFSQCRGQFEKTRICQLWKDPAMANFVANFKTKWGQEVQKMDDELARTILDAGVLPQGRLSVAFVLGKQIEEEPMLVLLAQWGSGLSQIKEAIDKTAAKKVEQGARRTTEDYRDVTITTITQDRKIPPRSQPGDGNSIMPAQLQSSSMTFCFVDDCLIASEDIDRVKFVVAQIKGADAASLAADSDYTSATKAVGPYHDIDVYVNLKQIIKLGKVQDTKGVMTSLGLDNVAAFACSVGLARTPDASSSVKAILMINGPKTGIFKMLDLESNAFRVPRFVYPSSCSVAYANINIPRAFDELAGILNNQAFPPFFNIRNITLIPPGSEGQPGIELRRDIIAYLGPRVLLAQNITKPFRKDSENGQSVFAVAVTDHTSLEKSLSIVHNKLLGGSDPASTKTIMGHTIYLLAGDAMPPFFGRPGARPMEQAQEQGPQQQGPKAAFAVTDDYLLFGIESAVEQAIRTLSSDNSVSVNTAKWYIAATSAIPSSAGMASVEDNSTTMELLWYVLKQTPNPADSDSMMPLDAAMMFWKGPMSLVDFSLLPDYDAVKKYFGYSAAYGASRPDGFIFEAKGLNAGL